MKGLVFNLGYGAYSLAFSLLLSGLGKPDAAAFQQALLGQAVVFTAGLVAFIVVSRQRKMRG